MIDVTTVEGVLRDIARDMPDASYRSVADGYGMVGEGACFYLDPQGRPCCLVGQVLARLDLLDRLDPMDNGERWPDLPLVEEFTTDANLLLTTVQDEQDDEQDVPWRVLIAERV